MFIRHGFNSNRILLKETETFFFIKQIHFFFRSKKNYKRFNCHFFRRRKEENENQIKKKII